MDAQFLDRYMLYPSCHGTALAKRKQIKKFPRVNKTIHSRLHSDGYIRLVDETRRDRSIAIEDFKSKGGSTQISLSVLTPPRSVSSAKQQCILIAHC